MPRFLCAAVVLLGAPSAFADEPVRFNHDVRPILSDNCFACHGPDSAHRKAGLRLDRESGLFGESDNGKPVVKGNLKDSLVWERITSADPDEIMPPPDSHKKLTAAQKATIQRWIEQGAPWEPHWSLVPPVRPDLPAVKDGKWERNPIDRFILARIEAAGLTPAPEADRRTLARRLSLDIVGLPPAPEDVDAFVNDRSPDAYERYVDKLLASPHYGEHRARYWLDAARYADTHGIHNDNYREMWPYRQWVIEAFNRNLPFDRFTVEQIAGDLLPGRTLEQQIASGFHRCNITTSEGGSINEEVEAVYAKDRVETTATVFLGLTAGCAACHDHKFDPITTKDFYSFAAFFRNTTQAAMDRNIPDSPPVIVVPRGEDRAKYEQLADRVQEVKATREQRKALGAKAFAEWMKDGGPASLAEPIDAADLRLSLPLNEGKGKTITGKAGDAAIELPWSKELAWGDGPMKGEKALKFAAKASIELPDAGDFEADAPFSVGGWVLCPPDEGSFVVASRVGVAGKEKGRGWSIEIGGRIAQVRLQGNSDKDAIITSASGSSRLQGGKWHHIVLSYDGSRKVEGLTLWVDGKPISSDQRSGAKKIAGSIRTGAPMTLGANPARTFAGGALADFRVYSRELAADDVLALSRWPGLRAPLASKDAKLTPAQKQELELLYLNRFDDAYRKAARDLATIDADMRAIRERGSITHVMQEKPGAAKAKVLFRGQYDQPRDEVAAATPASLHGYDEEWPDNRLGLAWWLVDERNPLMARVTVNRLWQEIFGQGLVRSSEDFGIMGETPSHPQLLDWLAVEFRESGWDVKRFVKMLVTSATYRQQALATPAKLEKDAANRLLSRGPRFRMDAEALRDFALASSGMLVRTIGGPSVKPYQPPGVWEAVAMFGSNTRFYKQDTGENLYRRSLYTFWKRTAHPASMDIFNAPSRENCTVRRERTNTPLQALVTMNDPQWVEAARHLAQRALLETRAVAAHDAFDARLDFITLRTLSRTFNAAERQVCRETLDGFAARYKSDADAAKKLIATGESKADPQLAAEELAAWTMLASQVMNTDEALNK